jgi:iron complex outermembrane receptor protein
MNSFFKVSAIAGAASTAVLSLGQALAQTPLQAADAQASTLSVVTVTANPLGASDLIAPVIQYAGTDLLLRQKGTLGETLDGTPGVSSTYFGPNASRPVIRGLDGDRIRILSNGGASTDASGLSYDHAVTADPLSIERIEVLRGPGALQYGGSAVGGVVNVIDNRIPREPLEGVGGKLNLGLSSGDSGQRGAAMVEGGNGRVGLHVDAFRRRTGDVRAPVDLACTQTGAPAMAKRMCNSASSAQGGAVGGTVFFDRGYLGASVSSYRNDYGTVAEDEVTIAMKSQRHAVEGLWRDPLPGWQSIKLLASHTDYGHTELEAGAPGTVFSSLGNDLRLEARHAPLGRLEGVVGLQGERTRFAAVGDEAFAPFSRTRSTALFVHEELTTGWGRLSFGARKEKVDVESLGNPDVPRFSPASRNFSPSSFALGALWKLAPQWQITGNLARTSRAPKDYELFADGPHLATAAYEVGDAGLALERATSADLGLQWQQGTDSFKLNVFESRFASYIGLESTGQVNDGLPEFRYSQVAARFRGVEASGTRRLLSGGQTLDLSLRADSVRASNQTTGQPLPRVSPLRVGASLAWAQGAWGARLGVDRVAAQNRVPAGEQSTPGYTLWNAALTWRMKAGASHLLWYARLDNAGNRLAYSATSILTQTAPGKAPLPGRSLSLGLEATF